jgi:uncharacterized DUF497 family protein
MRITWTEAKRVKTLQERDLDLARAAEIFAGLHATRETHGGVGGEIPFITFPRRPHGGDGVVW